MTQSVDDFLAHHGVLGMHWGKHLPGRTEASHNPRPHKRSESHPDHTTVKELTRNPTRTLSTAELKKINDRKNTEQQYHKLNPTTVARGKKIALGLVAAAGTGATVYNLVKSPAGKAAVSAGQKILDKLAVEVAKTYMTVI